MTRRPVTPPTPIERIVASVGSTESLLAHSFAFAAFFFLSIFGVLSWELMLLVLTTILSLEAIYLAIFIQITVNKHTQSLKDVEEDIDEISEDIEEISEDIEEISEDIEELGEDVEDIQEDLEEISEDIGEISEDIDEISEDIEEMADDEEGGTVPKEKPAKAKTRTKKETSTEETLEQISKDVARLLKEIEALKKSSK